MTRKQIPPHVFARLQKLDNARITLVVNGVLTSQQSREVRRKIMKQVSLTTKGSL